MRHGRNQNSVIITPAGNETLMQKTLIILGLVVIVIGLAWPLISSSSLGRLPGDIVIQRDNFTFYFPITTLIIISAVISLLVWIFRQL